jgi:ABC-type Mn2+/Zn2+ transport system ATPase subunit
MLYFAQSIVGHSAIGNSQPGAFPLMAIAASKAIAILTKASSLMVFQSASKEKILSFLGFPADDQSVGEVAAAMLKIEQLSDGTVSAAVVTRVQGYLAELDEIVTAIDTQRSTEASTILPELRREGRRYVVLVANALALTVRIDIFGATGT